MGLSKYGMKARFFQFLSFSIFFFFFFFFLWKWVLFFLSWVYGKIAKHRAIFQSKTRGTHICRFYRVSISRRVTQNKHDVEITCRKCCTQLTGVKRGHGQKWTKTKWLSGVRSSLSQFILTSPKWIISASAATPRCYHHTHCHNCRDKTGTMTGCCVDWAPTVSCHLLPASAGDLRHAVYFIWTLSFNFCSEHDYENQQKRKTVSLWEYELKW